MTEAPRPRIVGLVQARMTSTRLPGKALLDLAGEPMLVRVIERVRAVGRLDQVAVATGADASNDPIRELCASRDIDCYSGHDTDVLLRFLDAAHTYSASAVLRITADCPLVDVDVMSTLVALHEESHCHYAVAVTGASDQRFGPRYPDGLDCEVVSGYALHYAEERTRGYAYDREHVTRILWREPRPLDTRLLQPDTDMGMVRLTVDTPEDYRHVRTVYEWALDHGLPSTFSMLGSDVEGRS